MKKRLFILLLFSTLLVSCKTAEKPRTIVSIKGEQFYINNELTYAGRYWNDLKIEGLLFNSRMVQGIFDDLNPESCKQFIYPDTKTWDPDRNTNEFIAAMQLWKENGMLAFTLNLQGGSPIGYGNRDWKNPAFDENGNLLPAYITRLERILNHADELGMVVILGYFYFGQDELLKDETAVINATDNITNWILDKGYRNILIEINNECNVKKYDHAILKKDRIHELIERVKSNEKNGYRLLVSTSYGGRFIPLPNVVKCSDFILVHGNGSKSPDVITDMVKKTRLVEGYTPKPIVFNEDDHYDFDQDSYNMLAATKVYASWGFFDYRRDGEKFVEGYQSVPVDWGINSDRKKAFFNKVKEITGY